MGAVHVSQARGLITLITLMVVGVQLAVFTQLRFAGVVVMLVWLWPVAVGLTGLTSLALSEEEKEIIAYHEDGDGGRRPRLQRVASR